MDGQHIEFGNLRIPVRTKKMFIKNYFPNN
jgi:hypothetical protein